ncbi:MAG: arsenate reductase (glutaredoxin) [Candidatus Margulisiibacteriota bacterium]|nr:arsenate reductase (glutaredoxin) [Candidatus Margulisiibacteriota bacterium]
MSKIFYHNPRCSKSRQALALLEERNVDVDIRYYLKDGIDADEVVELSKKLDLHPSEFVRKGESAYKDLGTDEFSIEEWSDIIEKNPILLERPILVIGENAIIGRPPENVLQLLSQ